MVAPPRGRGGTLAQARVGGRTVRLTWGVGPLPDADGRAVEGFDTSPPPRDRAPRPEAGQSAPLFPSAAAIEAAKAAIRPAVRTGEQPIVSTSQPKEPK